MHRFVEWFYEKELARRHEASYNEGFRAATEAVLEVMRREKLVLFGEAPISGLNDFLARTPAQNVGIVGCHFQG